MIEYCESHASNNTLSSIEEKAMMTGFILASILVPLIGALLILLLPRSWIKIASQLIALLASLSSLYVLIQFTLLGKVPAKCGHSLYWEYYGLWSDH